MHEQNRNELNQEQRDLLHATADELPELELNDEDILDAMRHTPGYLDISTEDFREIYHLAHNHALERLVRGVHATHLMLRDIPPLNPDTRQDEAEQQLESQERKSLPAVDENRCVKGMQAQADFQRRRQVDSFSERLFQQVTDQNRTHRHHETQVREARTAPAITIAEQVDFPEIHQNHHRHEGHRMPVVDDPEKPKELSLRKSSIKVHHQGLSLGRPGVRLAEFFKKMRGTTRGNPPRVSISEVMWSWLGGFLGILAVAGINNLWFEGSDLTMLIASFGASAVLVYGAVRSPLAQPRNFVGGHVVSAITGVIAWKLFHADVWLASAFAVATAMALMHLTRTLHPPGGATALIAVIGSEQIHAAGFAYVLVPGTLGPLIMLAVALIVNNLAPDRHYPENWW